jgi:hypothetical protein
MGRGVMTGDGNHACLTLSGSDHMTALSLALVSLQPGNAGRIAHGPVWIGGEPHRRADPRPDSAQGEHRHDGPGVGQLRWVGRSEREEDTGSDRGQRRGHVAGALAVPRTSSSTACRRVPPGCGRPSRCGLWSGRGWRTRRSLRWPLLRYRWVGCAGGWPRSGGWSGFTGPSHSADYGSTRVGISDYCHYERYTLISSPFGMRRDCFWPARAPWWTGHVMTTRRPKPPALRVQLTPPAKQGGSLRIDRKLYSPLGLPGEVS